MCEYTLLFADPQCAPRAVSFEAATPSQALTIAQRKSCPAHLFKEGAYICTLECTGSFWIISHDPVGARTALVPAFAADAVAPFLGKEGPALSVRPPVGAPDRSPASSGMVPKTAHLPEDVCVVPV